LRPRRGFDRPPDEPRIRINEAIRVPQVRLIGADGEQIGVKDRDEALDFAWNQNLDLVEVAPDARPPVCRVMDYSKYKYEQEQKAKLARKHQNVIVIKEIKLRPKVGNHDYETKKGHVMRFLRNHDKVKVTIMFRGREMTHPEKGRELLLRLAGDLADLAVIESEPLQDGRNMVMMLAPSKALLREGAPETVAKAAKPAPVAAPEQPAPTAPAPEPVAVVEETVVAAAEPTPEPVPVPAKPKAKAPAKATKTTAAKPKATTAAKKPAAKATTKPTAATSTAAAKKTPTTRAKKAASASDTEKPAPKKKA
jgi:translation initiation factor IF-3